MASAHDLLVKSQWSGASFADLVAEELRPYDLHRIQIDGAPLWLKPKSALGLCLMVHELATNAAKYGALSGDEGRVSIDWRIADSNGEQSLMFSWLERGGPAVSVPSRLGFGSEIVKQFAAKELGGDATIDFEPEGVRVSLQAPLEFIAIATDGPPEVVGEPSRESVTPQPVSTPLRVLIVEDLALIAMDLETILVDAGHTVIGTATTVEKALALVDGNAIDVALLDVDLHGELSTPVAKMLKDCQIPFAFSTGFDEGGPPLRGFGDVVVLHKPFDDRSVISTLARLAESIRTP